MIITYFTFDEVIHDGVTWLHVTTRIAAESPEKLKIENSVT